MHADPTIIKLMPDDCNNAKDFAPDIGTSVQKTYKTDDGSLFKRVKKQKIYLLSKIKIKKTTIENNFFSSFHGEMNRLILYRVMIPMPLCTSLLRKKSRKKRPL